MRSFARRSIRLAGSSCGQRHCACSQFTLGQHVRPFHDTARRTTDPRGSSGPGDHPHSVRHQHGDHIRTREVSSTTETSTESAESPATNDVPNVRRTLRQRRNLPDVPQPPPIPDWFLEYNVKLQNNPVKLHGFAIACVDKASGEVLFTLPHFTAPRPKSPTTTEDFGVTSSKSGVVEGHVVQEHEKRDGKRDQRPENKDEKREQHQGKQAGEPKQKRENSDKQHEQEPKSDFFTSRMTPKVEKPEASNPFDASKSPETSNSPKASRSPDVSKIPRASKSPDNPKTRLESIHNLAVHEWVLLELDASARAAFSMQATANAPSSYATSNIDVSLTSPGAKAHAQLDLRVEDIASLTGADLIRFDANDLADLTSDYVGYGVDSPGWFSTLGYDAFDGYTSSNLRNTRPVDEDEDDDFDESDDASKDTGRIPGINLGDPANLDDLKKALFHNRHELAKALDGIPLQGIALSVMPGASPSKEPSSPYASRSAASSAGQEWDEARLRALLDHMLEAASLKRSRATQTPALEFRRRASVFERGANQWESTVPDEKGQDLLKLRRKRDAMWFSAITSILLEPLMRMSVNTRFNKRSVEMKYTYGATNNPELPRKSRRTIVHVRDISDICRTPVGFATLRRLIRVVQKRRKDGEEIFLVGTSAQETISPTIDGQHESSDLPLRQMILPLRREPGEVELEPPGNRPGDERYWRILEINLRHIQSMMRRFRPIEQIDLFSESAQSQLRLPGTQILSKKVLPFEHVQRIVLTAIGLSQAHAVAEHISVVHIALGVLVTSRVDDVVQAGADFEKRKASEAASAVSTKKTDDTTSSASKTRARIEELKKICNAHETRLLPGVVDAENIKTGFGEVHAPAETVQALKTLTSLALLRPDAFQYGVLANDRLPGLMLYGPPGTGKTLLAKAVAKESQATVLEISGAQIYEKYVGEGEKMVRAVFSLAKKLSPCIVFIDEADSILGARSSMGSRNTHREIINQFLREWDGMDSHNVFMMVASNRPFDLDDAVLRRLPRRLLVDLPVAKDRESILGIHLRDEHLDASVSLAHLAEQTPLYSGSDLKNLCVSAALACVREENELAERSKDEKDFKLPDKRTLSSSHFEQALREISASISEDMGSLTAIRKFDEQYGDRRGRRTKKEYGFGMSDQGGVDENAARIRQTSPPP